TLRQILLLSRLPVVEHQAKSVGFVPGALLRAVSDVLAIRRVERREVTGGIVGRDVPGLGATYRNDPDVAVGGSRFDLVVVRAEGNFLAVGGEGVVILSTEGEDGRIEVARGEIACGQRCSSLNSI